MPDAHRCGSRSGHISSRASAATTASRSSTLGATAARTSVATGRLTSFPRAVWVDCPGARFGEVLADGRGGEQRCGDRVAVEQRGDGQEDLGCPAGDELACPLGRQDPGNRGRRRWFAVGVTGQAGSQITVLALVVGAGSGGGGDHRAGLCQRQRVAVERGGQVDRTVPLVGIGSGRVHAVPRIRRPGLVAAFSARRIMGTPGADAPAYASRARRAAPSGMWSAVTCEITR